MCIRDRFQYGTFCPVMRLHGDREPHTPPMSTVGGGRMASGGPNEVWSYGETLYEMCRKYKMCIRDSPKSVWVCSADLRGLSLRRGAQSSSTPWSGLFCIGDERS